MTNLEVLVIGTDNQNLNSSIHPGSASFHYWPNLLLIRVPKCQLFLDLLTQIHHAPKPVNHNPSPYTTPYHLCISELLAPAVQSHIADMPEFGFR